MNKEDKLRFEIGECFNRLSQEEIDKLGNLKDNIYDTTIEEYGYEGDGPYYESIRIFCKELLNKYDNEEDFIQTILECISSDTYGWALSHVKDPDIQKYAKEKMIKSLKNEDYDEDDIEVIISERELPR